MTTNQEGVKLVDCGLFMRTITPVPVGTPPDVKTSLCTATCGPEFKVRSANVASELLPLLLYATDIWDVRWPPHREFSLACASDPPPD